MEDQIEQITERAKRHLSVAAGICAFAVAALENDPNPRFQMATAFQFGISDADAANPLSIALMRAEYRAWVVGHSLASMSEGLATMLDRLVALNPQGWGCKQARDKFERLGLEKKIDHLNGLSIDADLIVSMKDVTKVRNCLVHRHGVVDTQDCNDGSELKFQFRAVRISKLTASGWKDLDDSHRGPALSGDDEFGQLRIEVEVKRFALGSRVEFVANDFGSLMHTMGECIHAVEANARRLRLPT